MKKYLILLVLPFFIQSNFAQPETIKLQEKIGFKRMLNKITQVDFGEMYVSLAIYVKSNYYTGYTTFDATEAPYIYHVYSGKDPRAYHFNDDEFFESIRFWRNLILNQDTLVLPSSCDTLFAFELSNAEPVDSIMNWSEDRKYDFIASAFDEKEMLNDKQYDAVSTIVKMFQWGYFIAWDAQSYPGGFFILSPDMMFGEYIQMDSTNLAIYQSVPIDTIVMKHNQFKVIENDKEDATLRITDKNLLKRISNAVFPVFRFEIKGETYSANGYFEYNSIVYDNPYCTYPCDKYNHVVIRKNDLLIIYKPRMK